MTPYRQLRDQQESIAKLRATGFFTYLASDARLLAILKRMTTFIPEQSAIWVFARGEWYEEADKPETTDEAIDRAVLIRLTDNAGHPRGFKKLYQAASFLAKQLDPRPRKYRAKRPA